MALKSKTPTEVIRRGDNVRESDMSKDPSADGALFGHKTNDTALPDLAKASGLSLTVFSREAKQGHGQQGGACADEELFHRRSFRD